MVAESTTKAKAWVIFDRIVALAAPEERHSNPWARSSEGKLRYEPDYATLVQLLGVPLYLEAGTQSGVPALALDIWLSYELRRAGFDADAIWPRPIHPRILPAPVARLLNALRGEERNWRHALTKRAAIAGITSSSAKILGKNYTKQVDVIMTDWDTGPELLISTKRMDSSYGKNAANRVEESYGDAKNLRLRHPLAALGFAFGLRSDILQKEPKTAEWLFDLLAKLGREDDAYHATCLFLIDYADAAAVVESGDASDESKTDVVPEPGPEPEGEPAPAPNMDADHVILNLPAVKILAEVTPDELAPSRFLETMVARVLDATPITMHREARRRRDVAGK